MREAVEKAVPEAAMLAQQLEHRLRASAPAKRRPLGGDANLRFAAKSDALLASLPEVVKQALWKSVASIADQEARRALFALARSPGFMRLEGRAQRAMFVALSRAEAKKEHVIEMSILAESAFFARLAIAVQLELLALTGKHLANTNARALLLNLQECGGFSALAVSEQLELLRWIAGPKMPEQARADRVEAIARAWDGRRLELLLTVTHQQFVPLPAELQAEVLRDFLHAAERTLCFLSSMRFSRHAVVVFGELGRKDTLTYGDQDRDLRYRVRAIRFTRCDEKALIEWIESAKPSGGRFADSVLATLRMITANRGALRFEEYFATGGRRWVAPRAGRAVAADDAADRMLKEYLSRSAR